MNKKKIKIIGFIPAKKNSKDLKNKNLKKINNLSLFEIAILAAKKSKLIDQVYISSDSEKILKKSKKFNINIIKRKKILSTYSSSANAVILDFIKYKLKNLNDILNKKILAFAGIGNPESFFDLLRENNIEVVKTLKFPDHYDFKKKDIIDLNKRAKELNACLVTTEKDYFRLNNENKKNIKYLKLELIIDKKDEFIYELKKII